MPQIILASSSPRRSELLRQVNVRFSTASVDIDESPKALNGIKESALAYVKRMAYEKSIKAERMLGNDSIIITADTIGKINETIKTEKSCFSNGLTNPQKADVTTTPLERILIKPKNFADAKSMWQLMSGSTHQVFTAVCVCYDGRRMQVLVGTEVEFIELTDEMMQTYWQTQEPHDKAGAYAIQGAGAAWVKSIHGSYANVVGLPLVETLALIQKIQLPSTLHD